MTPSTSPSPELSIATEIEIEKEISNQILWIPKGENIQKSSMNLFIKHINQKYNISTKQRTLNY